MFRNIYVLVVGNKAQYSENENENENVFISIKGVWLISMRLYMRHVRESNPRFGSFILAYTLYILFFVGPQYFQNAKQSISYTKIMHMKCGSAREFVGALFVFELRTLQCGSSYFLGSSNSSQISRSNLYFLYALYGGVLIEVGCPHCAMVFNGENGWAVVHIGFNLINSNRFIGNSVLIDLMGSGNLDHYSYAIQ